MRAYEARSVRIGFSAKEVAEIQDVATAKAGFFHQRHKADRTGDRELKLQDLMVGLAGELAASIYFAGERSLGKRKFFEKQNAGDAPHKVDAGFDVRHGLFDIEVKTRRKSSYPLELSEYHFFLSPRTAKKNGYYLFGIADSLFCIELAGWCGASELPKPIDHPKCGNVIQVVARKHLHPCFDLRGLFSKT